VERVSVVGNSGSGKTTLAAELSRRLAAPHLELDALFQQADWQPLPEEEFRTRVAAFAAGDRWVVDGNYSSVQDLVWHRADTVVWLDPPRHRVMRRIIWRTLRRAITGAELWNGNRERWSSLLRADPTKSIIAWAWTRHRVVRARYSAAQADPANAHLTFVRLRSDDEVAALTGLAGLAPSGELARRPRGRPGLISRPRQRAGRPGHGRRARPC
jgi:adenylate kinase family enzyme